MSLCRGKDYARETCGYSLEREEEIIEAPDSSGEGPPSKIMRSPRLLASRLGFVLAWINRETDTNPVSRSLHGT